MFPVSVLGPVNLQTPMLLLSPLILLHAGRLLLLLLLLSPWRKMLAQVQSAF